MDKQKAKIELERLISQRYSLQSTIDLYEMENLTEREKEILAYGFTEGRKCELLAILYDLLGEEQLALSYLSDKARSKIDEIKLFWEEEDYKNLVKYLDEQRKQN